MGKPRRWDPAALLVGTFGHANFLLEMTFPLIRGHPQRRAIEDEVGCVRPRSRAGHARSPACPLPGWGADPCQQRHRPTFLTDGWEGLALKS